MSSPDNVRASTKRVLDLIINKHASNGTVSPVTLSMDAIQAEIKSNTEAWTRKAIPADWAQYYHYSVKNIETTDPSSAESELLAQYVLVLDALNFCFWPLQGYEYEHLACSLKLALEADPNVFSAESLSNMTTEKISAILQPPKHLPLVGETEPCERTLVIPLVEARTRLLREVGDVLTRDFQGKAANLLRAAEGSAVKLVTLVTAHFPGFRDHAQFGGDQVFYYKRAQIFVGDVWAAFKGTGLGALAGIEELTCFADYRIPQLFRAMGIIQLRDDVAAKVDGLEEIEPGSEVEMAIRCATVQGVELMRKCLKDDYNVDIHACELDWLLWETGERLMKQGALKPHHRTLTTYY